jgi:hypothetical protein
MKQKRPAALPVDYHAAGQQTKQKEREDARQDAMAPLLTVARP